MALIRFSFHELSLNLLLVYEKNMRKKIRCITNLYIGELAYLFVSQLGCKRANIPKKICIPEK
jgi:hypothetical protein